MKRHLTALIALVALASTAIAASSATAAAKRGTTIKLGKTSVGTILSTSNGFTVYEFSRDRRNKDVCITISGCASTWPAVTTKAKPVAARGVNARLLGSIKLKNGSRQVTYDGHPLYHYSGDFGPRQTDYVGISASGGTWYGIDAKGRRVK
jgi:predicted lipoprotein with Yx(FWY)xxD motif